MIGETRKFVMSENTPETFPHIKANNGKIVSVLYVVSEAENSVYMVSNEYGGTFEAFGSELVEYK